MSLPSFKQASPPFVIVSFILIFGICYPYTLYNLWTFYKHYDKIYFIKRRRFITLLLVILISANSLCLNMLVPFLGNVGPAAGPGKIVHHAIMHAHLLLYIVRVWCLYYDHRLYEIGNNKTWHSVINNVHFKSNWFMLNKSKYGNEKWLILVIMLPIFILIELIYIFLFFVNGGAAGAGSVPLIVWIACIISTILIWKRYPKIHDTLKIRNELKWYLVVNIVNMVVALVSGLILTKVIATDNAVFSFTYIGTTINLVLFYVLVTYPIKYNDLSDHDDDVDHEYSLTKSISLSHSNPEKQLKQNNPKNYISWIYYLNKKRCESQHFSNFMSFLVREFCVENLLFVTEYVQIKRYFDENNIVKNMKENEVVGICDKLRLPESDEFPVSYIISQYEQNLKKDELGKNKCIFEALKSLYYKYIEDRARYEINISYQCRQDITRQLFRVDWDKANNMNKMAETVQHNQDFNDIVVAVFKSFEAASCEIAHLLRHSYFRFKMDNYNDIL